MELKNYSIGRIILLTFLILASPSCKNLFSNSLKKEIDENRYVQHLILLILIITLLTLFGNPLLNGDENTNNIIVGIVIYVFFILLTKLDIAWNIGILLILTLYFFYENKKIKDIKNINEDSILDSNHKKNLIDEYNKTQQILLISIFGITFIGTGIYYFEKNNEILTGGGNFNMKQFFFN